jgi:hypothetical protein
MRIAALAPAFLLLSACEPNQLYLSARTVVGINAAVDPEQSNGTLLVGYDRYFATVIPRSVESTGSSNQTRDAMSALVCSNLTIEGITIRRYTESLATGEAAKTFARNLHSDPVGQMGTARASMKDFFDCFRDNRQPALQSDKRQSQ